MMITDAVKTLLLTFAPVTTLVDQRVYVWRLPQSPTLPAIRLQRVDEVEQIHLRGPVRSRPARVQVDSVGFSGDAAAAVDAAVHGDGITTGLRTFRGVVGGVRITLIKPVDVRLGYDADDLKQFKVMRDYYVWFDG